ncbi:hypothetical protein, partial [Coxiella burnetii]|uniref:hypothetical protein n=1 Tax=Coxiella burnetii TaxID=777 RepID=UPI0022329F27
MPNKESSLLIAYGEFPFNQLLTTVSSSSIEQKEEKEEGARASFLEALYSSNTYGYEAFSPSLQEFDANQYLRTLNELEVEEKKLKILGQIREKINYLLYLISLHYNEGLNFFRGLYRNLDDLGAMDTFLDKEPKKNIQQWLQFTISLENSLFNLSQLGQGNLKSDPVKNFLQAVKEDVRKLNACSTALLGAAYWLEILTKRQLSHSSSGETLSRFLCNEISTIIPDVCNRILKIMAVSPALMEHGVKMVYPLLRERFPAFHLPLLEEHRDQFLSMLFRQVGAPPPDQQQDQSN